MASIDSPQMLTNGTGKSLEDHCKDAWKWWKESLHSPKRVLAPMVEQSELPYRMLSREHGADLCYSPMIHARLYAERNETQRAQMFETAPEDRPLVVQFCGNDPQVLLTAARAVQDKCDAVDLNLGCPQGIARKGRYGAYLLEEQDLVLTIVRTLSSGLDVPLTVKIRLLPDREATIDYAQRIILAGASVLTVHGRNKDEKAQRVGAVDWAMVKRIRQVVGVPMIANGGISSPQDIEDCLLATGCDAAMSSEMSLAHPGVFRPVGQPRPSVDSVVARYLELVEKYKASVHSVHKPLRAHLFKLLYPALQMNPCIRDRLASTSDIPEMKKCTEELALTNWEQALQAQDDDEDGWFKASWYCRHRNHQSEEAEGAEVSNGSGRDPSAILQIQLKGIIEELAQGRDEWNKVQNEEIAMNRKQKASVKRRISKAEKLKAKYERKLNDLKKNKAEDDPGAEESVAKKAKTEGAAEETTADLESNK